jgi:hypothetical protein
VVGTKKLFLSSVGWQPDWVLALMLLHRGGGFHCGFVVSMTMMMMISSVCRRRRRRVAFVKEKLLQ